MDTHLATWVSAGGSLKFPSDFGMSNGMVFVCLVVEIGCHRDFTRYGMPFVPFRLAPSVLNGRCKWDSLRCLSPTPALLVYPVDLFLGNSCLQY